MFVVVILGLLAAMAVPVFQKVRESSRSSAMDNEARQLASAAQQYMLENNLTTVTAAITAVTGEVGAPLDSNVLQVSKGCTSTSVTITTDGTIQTTLLSGNDIGPWFELDTIDEISLTPYNLIRLKQNFRYQSLLGRRQQRGGF